jgi:hypothetical protein
LKDYFKKKEEKEQREKEEREENEKANAPVVPVKVSPARRLLNSIFGCEFFMQITLVLAVFGLFFYFSSKDSAVSKFIWD